MGDVLARVEASRLALVVGRSTTLLGILSGLHLLGMTLLVGAALVISLRLLDLVLRDRPVADVTGAAARGVRFGLAVAVASGALLVAPRLSGALQNSFFQIKMALLTAATGFHLAVVARSDGGHRLRARIAGGLALALWIGVTLAGCAFILLE